MLRVKQTAVQADLDLSCLFLHDGTFYTVQLMYKAGQDLYSLLHVREDEEGRI